MCQIDKLNKEKKIINLVWANVFGFLILIPISIIYVVPYYLIWGKDWFSHNWWNNFHKIISFNNISNVFLFLLIGIITHELIHGFFWGIFAKKGIKSIRFGIIWKMLTPYCHCKEPLKIKHYIIGAIMPAIILGLLPAIYALIYGSMNWLLFGVFFTMAAAGDFLVINLIYKENMNDYVQDHPKEAGCYIYRNNKATHNNK